MRDFKDNPFYRDTLEGLFVMGAAHINVGNKCLCPSGIMAFAYPERRYGYLAYAAIELEDIPRLIELAESKGFELRYLSDYANDENVPGEYRQSGNLGFGYSLPGAKWWTEFPENFAQVANA